MKDIVLQNIVFPADEAKMPLYIERHESEPLPIKVLNHRSCEVLPNSWAMFCSYFNAFNVGYWARFTNLEKIALRIILDKPAEVNVFRSNELGEQTRIHTFNGKSDLRINIPIDAMFRGGWLWFEIKTAGEKVTILEGAWKANVFERFVAKKCSIAITTFNKPDWIKRHIENFEAHIEDLENVDKIFIVDQDAKGGDFKSPAHQLNLSKFLARKLEFIHQDNLGGSGGFTRGMIETASATSSDFVMLIDDDTILETEAIDRAVKFATFARQPLIAGGHMFNIEQPDEFHQWAEIFDERNIMWELAPGTKENFSLFENPIRSTPWLHGVYRADWNGWWMCLIPREAIEKIGVSLPMFIKWDDNEFGLRAEAAGFETVSLPGVALWHQAFEGKNDVLGWQGFFHHRNRIIVGLLYSENFLGGNLIPWMLFADLKKILANQLRIVQLHMDAVDAIFQNPDSMFASLRSALPHALDVLANSEPQKFRLALKAIASYLKLFIMWHSRKSAFRKAKSSLTSIARWQEVFK